MENDNIITTLLKFEMDGYTAAEKKLSATMSTITKLNKKISELNKTQKENSESIQTYAKEFNNLEKEIDGGGKNIEALRKQLEQTKKEIINLTAENIKLVQQQDQARASLELNVGTSNTAQKSLSSYADVIDELKKGLGNAKVSIDSLTKAKKVLTNEMNKTAINSDEYQELSKNLQKVNAAMKMVTNTSADANKEFFDGAETIAKMRLKVSALTNEWKNLDRSTPEFAAKTKELAQLVEETKNAEESVGNYTRSVGNYQKAGLAMLSQGNPLASQMLETAAAAPSAKVAVKSMIAGVHGMNAALKSLLANPIVAIIAAVVVVFMTLKKALQSSEDSINKLNKMLAPLQRLMEFLLKLVQLQLGLVLQLVDVILDAVAALSRMLEVLPFVGKYLKEMNDEAENSIKLAEAEEALTKNKRENLVETAKREKDVSELRAKIAQKDIYTAAERKKMLEKAIELEKKNIDQKLAIAAEEKRIAEEYAKNTENTAEANDDLAEKTAALYIAQKEHADKMRDLNGQMSDLNNTLAEEEKERIEKAKAARQKYEDQIKQNTQDYINSIKDRQEAEQNLLAAQNAANPDDKEIEFLEKKLATKQQLEEAASKKHIKLSQEELATIEYDNYQQQKKLTQIIAESDAEKAQLYKSANEEYLAAEENLLNAKISGSETEISLYTDIVASKKKKLNEVYKYQAFLTDEELQDEELKRNEKNAKILGNYNAAQDKLRELKKQYDEATTAEDQQRLAASIENSEKELQLYADAANKAGVKVSDTSKKVNENFARDGATLTESLNSGLDQITEAAGKQENIISKLYKKIANGIGKAFDFSKATKGMDKNTTAFKKMKKDYVNGLAQIGAAIMANVTENIGSGITDRLQQEKDAVDELADYEIERAKKTTDYKNTLLDQQLAANKISDAKYKLEKIKNAEDLAKEENEINKKKANKEYEINLKTFRTNQAISATQTAISTAAAIMQGYSQTGPIAGSAFAVTLGALGATEVALIYAKKAPSKPKYSKGGLISLNKVVGPSHADGGVPVTIGGDKVAEVEGDEGALIVSKKAMKNEYIKSLLQKISEANRAISGSSSTNEKFANGGELVFKDYDTDFLQPAKNSLKITKRKKRSIHINGKKVKLKGYGWDADSAIDDYAEKIAKPLWNDYVTSMQAQLNAQEEALNSTFSSAISKNETLAKFGVTDVASYNTKTSELNKSITDVNDTIQMYKDAADARINSLKEELNYEAQITDFDSRKTAAAKKKTDAEKKLNLDVLKSMRDTGALSLDEYTKYCKQITDGYGATAEDIQNLVSENIEAVKKEIEAARDAELSSAETANDYRTSAVEKWESEWTEKYNKITEAITSDVANAKDLVSDLSDSDLAAYKEILDIQEKINNLSAQYTENETKLSDGIIESRSEREKLLEQQKEINKELEVQNALKDTATEKFTTTRENNAALAMKNYEAQNLSTILSDVDSITSTLTEQGNIWDLNKEVAAQYSAQVTEINSKFDAQVDAQDNILTNLKAQYTQISDNYDETVAGIESEKAALEDTYNTQVDVINKWLSDSTSDLNHQVTSLTADLNSIKLAATEVGLKDYQNALNTLSSQVDNFLAAGSDLKYADGGELNCGVASINGPSHEDGGVPIFAGKKQIAEVEGGESMFVVKKSVAGTAAAQEALQRISDLNVAGGGNKLSDNNITSSFDFDYSKLARLIGEQINRQPVQTFVTSADVDNAITLENVKRRTFTLN